MLAFGPNPARRAALAGTVLASLLACAALLCASMTAAEAQKLDPWLEGVLSRIDKELAKPTPPTETLLGSPVEMARLTYENAVRAYNSSKVRTKAHRDYVLGLRNTFAAEYKRFFFPPPQYDRPYTGTLTIERVADSAAVLVQCPDLTANHAGCAKVAKDRSWCKVYIVSGEYINRRDSAEIRKLFGYSYENFLRHELAHCNGWPGNHPR